MKKPYIKKFGDVPGFKVFIVDGKYIRDNVDEEFTNFGQHYRFKFIPKNELWIDEERVPGEEKFFIDYLLVENRLMAKGMSYDNAVNRGNIIEKMERGKSNLMKKRIKLKKHPKELIEIIHKNLLQKYSTQKIKVWIVDGETVRDLFYIDFTEGGHGYVYSFIPKNEVWIDNDLEPDEIKFVLLHEMHERALMAKGMKYEPSHASSSKIEYFCRKHPKKIDRELRKEIEKNNGD